MKKTLKIIGIILLILIVIIGITLAIGTSYVKSKLSKINVEEIDKTAVGITEEVEKELKGYRNIALFGIDSRKDDYGLGNRSDCIIIASLNQDTNEIKLVSVYRDTYMQVESNGKQILDKVTHAYSYGGPENALKALNTNLDLNITEYVTVNFDAVIEAVNTMGGVTINIDSSELKYINDYIKSTSSTTGVKSNLITNTGEQVLDGVQAVAYSRIRYTEGGDYKRAERMRTVINAMLAKVKTLDASSLNKLIDTILPRISTNITSSDVAELIPIVTALNITESIGWPYEIREITLDRWYGVPVTLESNVERLHKEVLGQPDYVVSETVKNISDQIVKKTGYQQ
ncbi:MAG: LCP family protein [Clostridia bacterium]|nr:LCP family protein [Clostridia bacterium]